jgi:hypothetical protein
MSTLTYEVTVNNKVVATAKTMDAANQIANKVNGQVRQVYKRVKETV